MLVNILNEGDAKVVVIDGRLDTVTAPELERSIAPMLAEKSQTVIFECKGMEYVSSSGLRVVLSSYKSVVSAGGKFVLRNLSKDVRSVFDLTGFSRILTIE
jgi:anti-anti-sigma factor